MGIAVYVNPDQHTTIREHWLELWLVWTLYPGALCVRRLLKAFQEFHGLYDITMGDLSPMEMPRIGAHFPYVDIDMVWPVVVWCPDTGRVTFTPDPPLTER